MVHFFKLIRWKNLLLIAIAQCLVKYALLNPFKETHGVATTLTPMGLIILILATVCIAAAGYIINDIEDIEEDLINKPEAVIINKHISEKVASNLFVILNVLGVGLGYWLCYSVSQTEYFALFVIASGLLYVYSTYLKALLLIGNITVSFAIALCIVLVGIFDLSPAITNSNRDIQLFFFNLIFDYAIFAFIINLLREFVKDIEDIDGDHKVGISSLPIVLGRDRATKVVFALTLAATGFIVYYVVTNLFKQLPAVGYFLTLVIAPLIYAAIKLFSAEHKADYKHVSNILKLVMLTGTLSLLIYPFILT